MLGIINYESLFICFSIGTLFALSASLERAQGE